MVVPGFDEQAHGMGGGLEKGDQRVGFVSHSSQCLVNEVVLMDDNGGYGHGASVMVMLVMVVTRTSSARVALVRLDSTSRFSWSSAVKSAWTLCTVC